MRFRIHTSSVKMRSDVHSATFGVQIASMSCSRIRHSVVRRSGESNRICLKRHGSHIVRENALGRPLSDIRRADRVDVVLTNPPFGGEEERGIQSNFPEATRISETSFLFLQLVQRLLAEGGRCGIVVSNRVLFGEGIGARIKQRLLDDCDLHTIVRLPPGVFEPYTDVPTNILFFEKTGRTKAIWYYQIPLPQDRRKYSKTKPLLFDEFDDCREWWGGRSRQSSNSSNRSGLVLEY